MNDLATSLLLFCAGVSGILQLVALSKLRQIALRIDRLENWTLKIIHQDDGDGPDDDPGEDDDKPAEPDNVVAIGRRAA